MKSALLATAFALTSICPALADDDASAMGAFLDTHVIGWATDPVLLDAIRAQNIVHDGLSQADIDRLDATWRAEVGQPETPTISAVVDNAASVFLRERIAQVAGITEIFVMDSQGLNVAASGPTSDYWQGDEEKFSQTAGKGPFARHFSEIEKDESSNSYQAQASFAIRDPETGLIIGAMTVGIDAEILF
ncbi:hypothetical protein [Maritimibacter sp. DP1N21-5]|uniref:hypothetical protein n=1 Tax=Maritimibacter sp. DP1N21-5 TaxID=2836867 RepID=UPI001C44ECC8|nr:hypothetical protein [Maritimibacter sp. DP1N21-5]MBV7409872.1 hypothetical protein [Maritimibacter sp. DP1N21-5]